MSASRLEHANITVTNPLATANLLVDIFGWRIRWQGEAKYKGFTVHVGAADSYLALYCKDVPTVPEQESYYMRGGLNHIGIVVDDLDEAERKVKTAGFQPHSHADYEPGRRFYFHDGDNVEFEVISYA